MLDNRGEEIFGPWVGAAEVRIKMLSSKSRQNSTPVVVTMFPSGSPWLCPVIAVVNILKARGRLRQKLGVMAPWLTAIDRVRSVNSRTVSDLIATLCGKSAGDFSPHSLRIGGACALLASGYSEEVIKLMGGWSSWCFTVYTRLTAQVVADVASSMRKALMKADRKRN